MSLHRRTGRRSPIQPFLETPQFIGHPRRHIADPGCSLFGQQRNQTVHIQVLQAAAIDIRSGTRREFAPDAAIEVAKEIIYRVGLFPLSRFGSNQVPQHTVAEQAVQPCPLSRQNHRNPRGAGFGINLFAYQPGRGSEQVTVEELHCLFLFGLFNRRINNTLLFHHFGIFVDTPYPFGHMAVVADKLHHHLAINILQIVVSFIRSTGPFGQTGQDKFQIADTQFVGTHLVVPEVFVLFARVVGVGLRTEPETRIALFRDNPLIQGIGFGLGRGEVRETAIAPLDGPQVVVSDTRIEQFATNAVFGLRHIVKAGIVHNRGRVAVLFEERGAAEAVHGGHGRRTEVVAQAERVAHLMRRHKANQVAHQSIVKDHFAGTRIAGRGLNEVPVAQQLHHVVVPVDVAFENFARAGVAHMRTAGVGHVRRFVDNGRIAGIFEAPGRVFFGRGSHFTHDGILEAGLFEGHLPVVHPGNQVGNPFFRRSGVDVEDNRFGRLDQFAAFVGFDIFGFGFQPPAGNHLHVFYPLRIFVVVDITVGKVPHPRVEPARLHRHFGQQNQRAVDFISCRHRARFVVRIAAFGRNQVAPRTLHLNILRESLDTDHVGLVLLEVPDVHIEFVVVVEAGQFRVAPDKVGHLNQQAVLGGIRPLDFERRDDGLHVGAHYRLVHVARRVTRHFARRDAFDKESFLVGRLAEANHVFANRVAGITKKALTHVGRRFRDAVHHQHIPPQQRGGENEIVFSFLFYDGEKPRGPFGAGFDDRFDTSFGSGFFGRGVGGSLFPFFSIFFAGGLFCFGFGSRNRSPCRTDCSAADYGGQRNHPDFVHEHGIYECC